MRPAKIFLCTVLGLALLPAGRAATGSVKAKTNGPVKNLAVFFPPPSSIKGSPQLLVVPLLGPGGVLLPGGKLMVWVGRNDGTPLADAEVTIREVKSATNMLVDQGERVSEVVLHTNADGIAEVNVAQDLPPENMPRPGS
jgi:hypothetical protein